LLEEVPGFARHLRCASADKLRAAVQAAPDPRANRHGAAAGRAGLARD
jgi:hypothetical protein